MSIGKKSEYIYLTNHQYWLVEQRSFVFPDWIQSIQIGDPTPNQLKYSIARDTVYNFRILSYDNFVYLCRYVRSDEVKPIEMSDWWKNTLAKMNKYGYQTPLDPPDVIVKLVLSIIGAGHFKTQPVFYKIENGIIPPDPRVLLNIKKTAEEEDAAPAEDYLVTAYKDIFGGI